MANSSNSGDYNVRDARREEEGGAESEEEQRPVAPSAAATSGLQPRRPTNGLRGPCTGLDVHCTAQLLKANCGCQSELSPNKCKASKGFDFTLALPCEERALASQREYEWQDTSPGTSTLFCLERYADTDASAIIVMESDALLKEAIPGSSLVRKELSQLIVQIEEEERMHNPPMTVSPCGAGPSGLRAPDGVSQSDGVLHQKEEKLIHDNDTNKSDYTKDYLGALSKDLSYRHTKEWENGLASYGRGASNKSSPTTPATRELSGPQGQLWA
ncbi:hypothetical protein NDU88_002227 [Pleurodeles waltl]|uniref:Uncharacterized protein n=1 Tax=Pleurodeles waltl TaxID=8319 RepID=A0AAV7T2K7_PLEWA|nr:hypothetical protein NDU88_002227 [Pleurodeles waltl]